MCLHDSPLRHASAQYIEALRRCKMGARLGEARQAFHAAFPLTEALWCGEWVVLVAVVAAL